MSRELMLQAKELIQRQRYTEARQILETVDHPKAKEWLLKLDEIELGNPFPSLGTSHTPAIPQMRQTDQLFQSAISVMLQNDWQLKTQLENTAQFEKSRGPRALTSALVIIFLSLLGTLIVCAAIATAKKELVIINNNRTGRLQVTTNKGSFEISSSDQLVQVAQSVKRGVSYGGALLLGFITLIFYLIIF